MMFDPLERVLADVCFTYTAGSCRVRELYKAEDLRMTAVRITYPPYCPNSKGFKPTTWEYEVLSCGPNIKLILFVG